jgi:DNA-binding ferritin-like protein
MATIENLAQQFRTMQLFAHIGHNKASGPSFLEDHGFLGELYGTYEGIYDDLAERMLGLGESPDLWAINEAANEQLQGMRAASTIEFFKALLANEKAACVMIEELVGGDLSEATINLLVQIEDDSEKRQYKIQQRIGASQVNEKPGDALDRLAQAKMKEKKNVQSD